MTGYAAREAEGRHVTFLTGTDFPPEADPIFAALASARGWRGEIKVRHRDGHALYMLCSITPLYADDGTITHYLGLSVDISKRKQAEQALRKSEEYWRALVENAPAYVLIVDREGLITRLNRAATGATIEDVLGRSVFEFLPTAEDVAAWRRALCAVFESGESATVENQSSASGRVRWYSSSVGPVYERGRVTAAIVLALDVTERKEGAEALRRSEEYWRALVESVPDLIAVVDRAGVVQSLNRACEGNTVKAVLGRAVFEFALPQTHEMWRAQLRTVFEEGHSVEFEEPALDARGDRRWYSTTIGPVYEDGVVVAAVISERDITERKEAEERLRALATAVPEMIVLLDAAGCLLEVLRSPTKETLQFGTPEELRGRFVHELVSPAEAERVLAFVRRTIETGQLQEAEDAFELAAGRVWVNVRAAPLALSDGTQAVVMHAQDVSERVRLEEELQRLREEIEERAEERLARGADSGLTFREVTVLTLMARGKSDKEIAALLGLSPFTVNKHASNLVRKLAARSRTEAAARAVREGII
jgi:PAS domain S-box-containing protein